MDPLDPALRQRLLRAACRPLRVRRAILLLAGRASGHPWTRRDWCPLCQERWPCAPVRNQAAEALDALAEMD